MASLFGSFGNVLGAIGAGGPVAGSTPTASAPLGSGQSFGKQYSKYIKQQTVAASATQNLINVTGKGVFTKLFIAMIGSNTARNQSYVNFYVDGETTPSFSCPINLLFQSAYAPTNLKTRFFGTETQSGNANDYSGYIYLRAPFNTSLKVDFVNGDTTAITQFWHISQYVLGGTYNWGPYGRLRNKTLGAGSYNATGPLQTVAAQTEQDLLNYTGGPGLLDTLNFLVNADSQNYALEGLFKIYIDGETTPSYQSSGTEDMFNGSFYFQGGNFATDYVGCTVNNGNGANNHTFFMYRLFKEDPFLFNTGIRLTWTNGYTFPAGTPGLLNQQAASVTVLSNVTYYTAS